MYSEHIQIQISKMKRFAKIVNGFQMLTIFSKSPILDVWRSCEYACKLDDKVFLPENFVTLR